MAWVEPGRAVAALHDQRNVLFYKDGGLPVVEPRNPALDGGPEALSFTRAMGPLWGSTTGQVAQLVDLRFEILPRVGNSPLTGSIRAFADYPGGAIYATENGWLGQVSDRVGVCVPKELTGYSRVFGAVARGEEVVVIGRTSDGNVRAEILAPE